MEATVLQKLMKMAIKKFRKNCKDKQMMKNRKNVNMLGSLPDDILLEILKRVPDASLRYKAKYVCKQWFNIISNKILLDHASFILKSANGIGKARLVDIREESQGLQVKERYPRLPFRGNIESWCNEFLLIRALRHKKRSIYVFNLITKVRSYLPDCTSCVGRSFCTCEVALFFDKLKGVYKVFRVTLGSPCYILIFKSDIVSFVSSDWKNIKVPGYMRQLMIRWCPPVLVQAKYFLWKVGYSKYLVSMDMLKEVVFQVHLPTNFSNCKIDNYSVFEMGGSLALLRVLIGDKIFIWILKDLQRMKWEKLHSLSLVDQLFNIRLISSVISKRYIIFRDPRSKNSIYSCELKHGVFKELNIKIGSDDLCVVHTSAPTFI